MDNNPANKDLNGVSIRRVYFTGDFTLSEDFSSRFRLETHQLADQSFGVYVKDAWLKWKGVFSGSDLVFGISPTPAFDVSEGAWGHRHLEKTIMDLNGIVGSRDMGIDLKGKFDQSGTVRYWIKVGNNSGNKPEANKYKRFYGQLEFVPSSNLLITVYGDYASAPDMTDPYNAGQMVSTSSVVGAAFLNYKQKGQFSFGLEGFIRSMQNALPNSTNTALRSKNAYGISVWAYANLSETAQIVGRFDTFDPDKDVSNDGRNLILAGVQFNPIKDVSITPNVEIFTYQATPTNGGDKSDVVPRVTFFWKF